MKVTRGGRGGSGFHGYYCFAWMCTDEVTTPESQAEAYITSEDEPWTDESGTTTYIRG